MKNALIVSLQFRVAHVAHLVASYKQMEELGYSSQILCHPNMLPYLPKGLKVANTWTDVEKPDIAIFWFPALGNINLMKRLKKSYDTKIIYVLHEPIEKFSSYRSAGLTYKSIFVVYAKYVVTSVMLGLSDFVILPSKKALRLYENNFTKKLCKRYCHMPLLFSDDSDGIIAKREYISYIGTIAKDHAFIEFVNFVKCAANDTDFPEHIKFLIATRNTVDKDKDLQALIESERLKIIEGSPLSEAEINQCYADSICVWNAYHRTTQSGVLAKASMFGTPAIACKDNLSEFCIDGKNVVAIKDNSNYEEIKMACIKVLDNFDRLSASTRSVFEELFDYRRQCANMQYILHSLYD